MADTRTILLKLLGKETVSTAGEKAAKGLGKMGDAADKAARDAKGLDRQLAETYGNLRRLQTEAARSDDPLSFVKDINRQKRNLKQLTGMLGELGDDGAEGFAARFSGRLGPLLASAPISPPLLAAIAAATPAIAAATSAAVLAGITGGVVAVGVKAALTDPRVAAAGESLGRDLAARMSVATQAFVPATLGAIDIVRKEVTSMEGNLRRVFDKGAVYVAPLTRAVTSLVRGSLPGISAALEKAAPVVQALEQGLGAVGEAAGQAIAAIADGASGASLIIRDLLGNSAVMIRAVGEMIGFLSKSYGLLRLATAGDKTAVMTQMLSDKAAAAAYQAEFDKLVNSLKEGGSAARTTAAEVRSLDQIMSEFADSATMAWNAETKFGEVLDEITRKAVNAGAGISANTTRGRENRDALEKLATQTRESAAALAAMAGGQAQANAIMGAGYARFLAVAEAMGIDARRARELATQLGLIPKKVEPKVKTQGGPAAIAEARRIERKLQEIERTYYPVVHVRWDNPRNPLLEAAQAQSRHRASGGPVTAGEAYIVGERQPEVFVPNQDGTVIPSISKFHGMHGVARGGTTVVVNAGVIGSRRELEDWLAGALDSLKRKGRA